MGKSNPYLDTEMCTVIAPWRERKIFFCFIFTKRFLSLTCEFQAKSHANQNLKARKRYLTNQLTEDVFLQEKP